MHPSLNPKSASLPHEQQLDLLPHFEANDNLNNHCDDGQSNFKSSPSPKISTSRVECLDGLRGIACIAVFNYHFLWPWTRSVMLGHGFLGPLSPEPYQNWLSLPIVSLLYRGRAMVSIFFAISGYVICQHIVRSIHNRDWKEAYRSLTSSAFRRAFRLYIPPTLSMLLVAVLAQTGAFRSEKAIYHGPDSVYINGSLAVAQLATTSCPIGTVSVTGSSGIADFLGVRNVGHLSEAIQTEALCINRISLLVSPVALYGIVQEFEHYAPKKMDKKLHGEANTKQKLDRTSSNEAKENKDQGAIKVVDTSTASLVVQSLNMYWVQYGGSWEEHPLKYDSLMLAVQNFTRVYAEWANPFNFNHYHPRYDPHTYTMPIEFRGSMMIYMFLLGTLTLKTTWRLSFAALLSTYSIAMGRWDMGTFLAGAILSEIDIWMASTSLPGTTSPRDGGCVSKVSSTTRGFTAIRWAFFVLALYLLSYPDVGAEHTPGFVLLSWFVPRYYYPLSQWMFYQSIGSLLLIPCIIHSPFLSKCLEGRLAQYLGRISFSFYLVHGPLLHCLGFWLMPRLFERLGRPGGYLVGWLTMFPITIYLSHLWYRKIDVWSTTVGKQVERLVVL